MEVLPHELIQQEWEHSNKILREQLLAPKNTNTQEGTLKMFITTLNPPHLKEIISKYWPILGKV